MSTRRLAAIMFTDIVGYTAMMQRDEATSMAKVSNFRRTMAQQVEKHHGELLEIRGDGSLSVFSSATDAVSCAKEIQGNLREDVPLRIGIHLGDVVQKDAHIFGDAVNIASRIESMGVAGAILISSNVRNQIKNKPEFELTYLGRFAFKNVEEAMSVYALANEGLIVPDPQNIKGKGQKVQEQKSSPRVWIRGASIGFGAMIIGAMMFWLFSNQDVLSDEIRTSRIAVLPFENQTNNPKFDALGNLAADHIIQGLMNLDDVNVASYETVSAHAQYAKPGKAGTDFAERTGAQKLIRGSIYQEGDSLFVQSKIEDIKSGALDMMLPEIKAPVTNPRSLVNELRSRILGAFHFGKFYSDKQETFQFDHERYAPKLEAFEAYQTAMEYIMINNPLCRKYLEEAIRLDSTYFWPHQIYFFTWLDDGKMKKADSVKKLIDRRFPNLSGYERLYQDFNQKLLERKGHESLPIIEELYRKDPKHTYNNFIIGLNCLYRNLPQRGIDVMSNIQVDHYPAKTVRDTWWHGIYAFQLLRKDRDKEARRILSYVPNSIMYDVAINSRLLYHAKQGQIDSVLAFIDILEREKYSSEQVNFSHLYAASYFAKYGFAEASKVMAQKLLQRLDPEEPNKDLPTVAYILAGEYEKALEIMLPFNEQKKPPPGALFGIGWIYGQQGKGAEAKKMLERFITYYSETEYENYGKAIILAGMRDQTAAMEALTKAFQEGQAYYTQVTYDFDFFLFPMLGYEPFEQMFVSPEG